MTRVNSSDFCTQLFYLNKSPNYLLAKILEVDPMLSIWCFNDNEVEKKFVVKGINSCFGHLIPPLLS